MKAPGMAWEQTSPTPSDRPAPDAVLADSKKGVAPAPQRWPRRRWRAVLGVVAAVLIVVVGVPRVLHRLRTVSTDDAYVNSYASLEAIDLPASIFPRFGRQCIRSIT